MLSDRRVKIVTTIGPSSNSKEKLFQLIKAGVNVVRLNFSHGTQEDHIKVIQFVREASAELNAPVTILQDLQGPKIRVGQMKGDSIRLTEGSALTLTTEEVEGTPLLVGVDYSSLPKSCKVGTRILLDDGLIELNVVKVEEKCVQTQVIFGGILKSRKGVNIPGAELSIECLTKKDLKDLEFGLKNNVDYVALSFVRHEDDIIKLRSLIEKAESNAKIVAKIEMLEALRNLKNIVMESDAVMVARGDLAVEVGQSLLPGTQKNIIRICNEHARPVITATQMLESMVVNPRPTRAEVTDVANAVLDGSDALMLSAETASGKYPVRCVEVMDDIILEVERSNQEYYNIDFGAGFLSVADSIAASACLTALKLDAKFIACLTTSGKTARQIASYRPKAKILAVTNLMHTLNRLELVWGIQTLEIGSYDTSEDVIRQLSSALLNYKLVEPGDKIILTMGLPVAKRGKTDSLRVYTVPEREAVDHEIKVPLRFL